MKKLIVSFVLFLMLLPLSGFAYQNSIEILIDSESGEYSDTLGDADVSSAAFGIGYTRYFKDIVTEETPYGIREFLQHPSYLGFALIGTALIIDDNQIDYTIEQGMGYSTLAGGFFMNDRTGFELMLISGSGNEEEELFGFTISDTDIERDIIDIGVTHYINEYTSLKISYELEDGEYDYGIGFVKDTWDTDILSLSVATFINNMFLEATLGTGSRDWSDSTIKSDKITQVALDAGFFTGKQNKIFISYNSEKYSESYDFNKISIGDELYLTDMVYGSVELYKTNQDYINSAFDSQIETTGLTLMLGFKF